MVKTSKSKWITMLLIMAVFLIMSYLVIPDDAVLAATSVSSRGSFQYDQPLKIPEGTAGVGPNLAIRYDSQQGNGMLGMGFYLNGLSSISRNAQYPINFDGNDHYALDGEKLVFNYSTGYYHTERETYIRIQAFNLDAANSYWVVTHKNGTKYYYGYTSTAHTAANDGHIDGVGKDGKALTWALSRVEDTKGNYYTVLYNEDATNGDFYPQKIIFTDNDTTPITGKCTVEFTYEARTDHWKVNVPTLVDMDQRLKWITINVGNNLLRKYRFDYEYGTTTQRSRLTAIQEYGSDGTSMLPTQTFSWQSGGDGTWGETLDPIVSSDWDPTKWHMADVNGDGKTDSVSYYNGKIKTFFSNGDGTWNEVLSSVNGTDWDPTKWYMADVNGDGKIDSVSYYNGKIKTFFSNGDGTWNEVLDAVVGSDWDPAKWQMADVNGDGKIDSVSYYNGKIKTFFSNGDGTWNEVLDAVVSSDWDPAKWQMADVNGDGLMDSVSYYSGKIKTFFSNGDGTWREVLSTVNGSDWDPAKWQMADVNGDGVTDSVSYYSGKIKTFFSKGDGTWREVLDPVVTSDWDATKWRIADVNGDGLRDSISYYNGKIKTFFSAPSAVNDLLITINNGYGGITTITYQPAPQVSGAVVPTASSYPSVAANIPLALVSKLQNNDGVGSVTSSSYEYYNCKVYSGVPADRTFLGFEWIKKKDDTTGNYSKAYYRQDKPYQSLLKEEQIYDASNKLYTQEVYNYTLRHDSGSPAEVNFVYLVSKEIYYYDGSTTEFVKNKVDLTYDAYGNIATTINNGYDHLTYDKSESRTEYCYNTTKWIVDKPKKVQVYGYNKDLAYVLQEETLFYYDGTITLGTVDIGKVTKEILENGTNDVTIEHNYDTYGNKYWTKNGRGYITETTYDPDYHKYVTSVKDAKGFYSYRYYDAYMRLIEEKDINGVSTNYRYDTFSRLNRKWIPPDTETALTEEITYYDSVFPSYIVLKKREDTSGGVLESRVYYDGFRRVIQTKAESESAGTYVTMDTWYDSFGREYQKSQPYFSNTFTYSTRNTNIPSSKNYYDAAGRTVKKEGPDGTYSEVAFVRDVTVLIDPERHVKKLYEDGLGNVVKVEEYLGLYPSPTLYATTVYAYNTGTGQLVKINDNNGNQIIIAYDLLGRKTSLRDPDAGIWTYTYDQNGNLLTKKDAKIQTISYTYDVLDRLTRINYPNTNDTYFYYDEAGYGKSNGRMTRAMYQEGSESFVYDDRGRTISHTVAITGISRTQSYTYDSQNRVKTITYPDGEVVSRTYNTQGEMETLNGNNTYISSMSYNPLNQVSQMSYGNGITTTYEYYDTAGEVDSIRGLTNSYRLKGIYAGDVLQVEYNYDKAGNILKRTDLQSSDYTQEYTYDELNRLTRAYATVFGEKLYSYNKIGNIISKDGLTLEYTSGKPHAVTRMGNRSFTYDANGNMESVNFFDYEYNEDNMLVWDDKTWTEYGYFGSKRVWKQEGDYTTRYFFDTYEEVVEIYDPFNIDKIKYYYANNQRIAQRSSKDGLSYYHNDHLLSSSKVTDTTGAVVRTLVYRPYGEPAVNIGTADVNYTFNSKEQDRTGLYYFGSRYYDPILGRFTTPDVFIPSPLNPQSLNRYSFALNNPVVYMENKGNGPVVVIGFVVGAVIGGITNGWEGALIGGVTGAISAGVYSWAGGGFIGGLAGGTAGGMTNGALNTVFNGGNFFENMMLGAVTGAVAGGISYGAYTQFGPMPGGLNRIECAAITFTRSTVASTASGSISGAVRAAIGGEDIGDALKRGVFHGALSGAVTTLTLASMDKVCFVAGTKIWTKDGYKNIEDIKTGDEVWAFNEKTGEMGYQKVQETYIRETREIIEIIVGGEKIETTREHPFWVKGQKAGWVEAQHLKAGMKLLTGDYRELPITSVKITPRKETVYNFEVENWHSYSVSSLGIIVHNADYTSNERFNKWLKDEGYSEWLDSLDPGQRSMELSTLFNGEYHNTHYTYQGGILDSILNEIAWSSERFNTYFPLTSKALGEVNFTYKLFNSLGMSNNPGQDMPWEIVGKGVSDGAKMAFPDDWVMQRQFRLMYKGIEEVIRQSDKTGTDDGCVICTELYRQGYMPEDVFKADNRFGQILRSKYPLVLVGYHSWAKSVVKMMQRSKRATEIINVLATPWAEEMAYRMGVRDKGNVIGKIYLALGIPLCLAIGAVVTYPIPFAGILLMIFFLIVLIRRYRPVHRNVEI